ncbi:holo-[acyl-carrier protein] synthase [Gracilibacillus halotolerans]|uniref:Holo-[acyl-carrier-protein] synthase n=1 Tax=Gracilibacillus halotolerans TaxID=74386 RepID=A0A841RNA6_9BACI|nr:holo-ACP synthase [Gracilibacillus halotolerans]MBB6513103.1 holo-[acyl-carrier protein] synthase [Gracilibacillus halotolerans]
MIIGIGIDLVEIDRITDIVEKGAKFVDRILTEREKELLHSYTSQRRKIEFIAGRFAAKEAFSKALGTGIGEVGFKDIEILPDPKGAPHLTSIAVSDKKIHLSISHSKEYAIAQVIIETVSA